MGHAGIRRRPTGPNVAAPPASNLYLNEPAAPLPTYQRSYSGNRYPRDTSQQSSIGQRNYSYEPQDRQSRQERAAQAQAQEAINAQQRQDEQARRAHGERRQDIPKGIDYNKNEQGSG